MKTTPHRRLLRAVAYIRVSKLGERTKDDLISDKAQLASIKQHAKQHGYEIVEVITDLDESGRQFERRQVAQIIQRVKDGEIDAVLLWKWSRWGRNTIQSLIYIAQVENAGGRVEAATEHFNTETSYGKFSRHIFLAVAELQSDQIGDSWKDTHEYLRSVGLPHAGGPRFGYHYHPRDRETKTRARYEVDESLRELIKSAYERVVADTATFRSLAIEWNELGVKTTQGKEWTLQSVRNALDTGFAAGLIRERSAQPKGDEPKSKRLEAFDVWREGVHSPIIEPELWERYSRKRKLTSEVAPAARTPKHAMSGVLFCPECGQTMKSHLSGNRGTYRQWVCRRGRDFLHRPVTISDIRAQKIVREWLFEQAKGTAPSVTEEAQRIVDQRVKAARELGELEKEMESLTRRKKRLQMGWLDGLLEDSFYEEEKVKLSGQEEQLRGRIERAEVRDERSRARPAVAQFRELGERWDAYLPIHQRAALLTMVQGAVVVSSRELLVVPAFS